MTETEPLLRARDLRVAFAGTQALGGVSLDIARGTLFGLIGPNGAGKTTLIEAVAGFLPQARGDVIFAGEPVNRLRPDQRAQRGLVRTFQSLELFEDLTVRENLLVAAEKRTWLGSVADLARPGRVRHIDVVEDALELLGLTSEADMMPTQLSNGKRKLVAVGRALAARARLVMLDEPAAGLDTAESQELGRHLRAVVDRGTTMLLVDHDMGLVLGVCDRVHVLDFGQTIAEGTPDEVRASQRVMTAYLGEDPGDFDADAGPATTGEENGTGPR
jgi:branched-chain amino acid transport system ATP-binding protein